MSEIPGGPQPEMPGGPWPDELAQRAKELDTQLAAEGLEVFDPATKSPNPDSRTGRVGEVSLDAIQAGQIPVDRVDELGISDHQPDTPVESVQREELIKHVRKTLDLMPNAGNAEVLRRRHGIETESGQPETLEEIAKDLPRADGSGEKGVSRDRVRQRESDAKFTIHRDIRRSGSAGHPFEDFRGPLDKQ